MKLPASFLILLFISMCPFTTWAQNEIEISNSKVIDSLKDVFQGPCTLVHEEKISSAKRKKDVRLIRLLNKYYKELPNSFEKSLYADGFKTASPSTIDSSYKSIYAYYLDGGNLKGFIEIYVGYNGLNKRKILIATNSKFSCGGRGDGSFRYSFIDFLYVQQILAYIEFPFRVSYTGAELQSELEFNASL